MRLKILIRIMGWLGYEFRITVGRTFEDGNGRLLFCPVRTFEKHCTEEHGPMAPHPPD